MDSNEEHLRLESVFGEKANYFKVAVGADGKTDCELTQKYCGAMIP